MRSLGQFFKSLFQLALWAVAIAGLMRVFFVDVLEVPHNGMAPTITYGDQVLVWRRAKVDMGDVVICQHPTKPDAWVLGRAVAFAGHTVSSDGHDGLMVDDDRASVEWEQNVRFFDVTVDKLFNMRTGSIDYRRKHRHAFFVEDSRSFHFASYRVQRGIFLLGDNRGKAWDDSRQFGEVDPEKCRGEVFLRLTPAPDRSDDVHHGYVDFVH